MVDWPMVVCRSRLHTKASKTRERGEREHTQTTCQSRTKREAQHSRCVAMQHARRAKEDLMTATACARGGGEGGGGGVVQR
jgi:hypothetical protein